MKISTFRIALLMAFSGVYCLNAQTVQWAEKGISPGFEYGNAIVADETGAVYVAGQIEYTTQFNGYSLSSRGSHDIFAGKYSPNGTIKWLKSAGGNSGDVAYGIGVDAQHNCYITGEIEDTSIFENDTLFAVASNDIFVAKYDSNGDYLWSKSFGSAGNDKGYSMKTNPAGECFITGYYSSGIDFDNIHLGHSGSADVYTLKLDANGNVEWAERGGGNSSDRGHGITYDNNGNIYVAGYFTEEASFNGTTITTSTDTKSAFVVKYNSSGNFRWVSANCCDSSEFNAIAVDENGDVYTTGFFYNTATFGSTTLNSTGDADIAIVKYDPNGNVLWAKQAGGPYEDEAFGITVDSVNHAIYITGQIDDHGYFDSHYAGAAGNRDVFVAAYDYNGNNLWVKPYGGVHRDIGYAITNDPGGYVFTTGIFFDNASFGNYHLTGDLLADFFVNKIAPASAVAPVVQASNLNVSAPNCYDLDLSFTPGDGVSRIIVAKEGSQVSENPVDGMNYNAGSVFATGDNLGNGNFVVYNGNGNSMIVSGLSSGQVYHFAIFEYNGSGATVSYLTTNPARASQLAGTSAIDVQSTFNIFCDGDSVTLTASGGSNYQWFPSGGLSSSTGNSVIAFPNATTTYTVTADNNGCQVQNTITLTVNPIPSVILSLHDTVCVNGGPLNLSGGLPSGGTYSGNGISSNIFHPGQTGVGTFPVTYTYTDSNGCTDSDMSTINVSGTPSVSLGNDTSICSGYSVTLHAGNGFASYLWSNGSMASSITVDTSGVGLGNTTVFVQVENNSGCMGFDTININFDLCAGIYKPADNTLLAYPNPFVNTFQLSLKSKADIRIYDLSGRLVEKQIDATNDVRMGENLSPGMYNVQISDAHYRTIISIAKSSD